MSGQIMKPAFLQVRRGHTVRGHSVLTPNYLAQKRCEIAFTDVVLPPQEDAYALTNRVFELV